MTEICNYNTNFSCFSDDSPIGVFEFTYEHTPEDKQYRKHVIPLTALQVLYFQQKTKAAHTTDHLQKCFSASRPTALVLSPNRAVATTDIRAFLMSNG